MNDRRPRVGFVLEQTLGHITHSANLRELVADDASLDAVFAPIEFAVTGWAAKVPGYSNWTIRAGIRSRRAIRVMRRGGRLDGLFVHTQVPAVLTPDILGRVPTVVSLDATPAQYDELGSHYAHDTDHRHLERMKWNANRLCFDRAAAIVTWAEWTKSGLVDDYEVRPEKITVIPPGVDHSRWAAVTHAKGADATVRVLFVGGDFVRKGGDTLVEAVRRLRHDGTDVHVDIVTHDDIAAEPGVAVHRGLAPNSPTLIDLYRRADIFCLPTLGDCLPMVLSEAGAVGLPLVSTDVGAIREIVRPDETGLLVPLGDPAALAAALGSLVADEHLRLRLGEGARRLARTEFDAVTNANRLVTLLRAIVEERRAA